MSKKEFPNNLGNLPNDSQERFSEHRKNDPPISKSNLVREEKHQRNLLVEPPNGISPVTPGLEKVVVSDHESFPDESIELVSLAEKQDHKAIAHPDDQEFRQVSTTTAPRYKWVPEHSENVFWDEPRQSELVEKSSSKKKSQQRNYTEFANLMKLILFVTVITVLVVLANAGSTPPGDTRKIILVSDRENNPELVRQIEQLNIEKGSLLDRDVVVEKRIDPAADFPFTLILVGKDGINRFSSHSMQSISALKNIIDDMPLRKKELNKKSR